MNEWWEQFFGTLSFMAAALSGYLWFRASRIKIPPFTGDSWDGNGPFSEALANQSKLNAHAAFAATFAAFFQAISLGSRILGPYILPYLN